MMRLVLVGLSLLFLPWSARALTLDPVLSARDVTTYRQLFQQQRRLNKDQVAKLAEKLDNPLLMGHVTAVRLLHPHTRIPYKELQAWLKLYNDHPQARDIYDLANKRRPAGETHKAPLFGSASAARYTDLDTLPAKAAPAPKESQIRPKLQARLRKNSQTGNHEASLKLLTHPSARVILGGEEWADKSVDLAQKLMKQGKYMETHHLMALVSKYQTTQRLEALWLSGFAGYRAGFTEAAASAFRSLVYAAPKGSRAYTRAAWWAGRTYQELSNTKLAHVFLSMAAENESSFYGQLALSRLEQPRTVALKMPEADPQELAYLLEQPAIQRVIALAQVGEFTLAQNDLKNAYSSLPTTMDETLLSFSLTLHLPHMAFTLAHNLRQQGKTFPTGLYPLPTRWRPLEGFQIDPAMLMAIMRQESAFDPTIISRAGARGLMQIMPDTADYIREINNKFTLPVTFLDKPSVSLSLAQEYIQYLHNKMDGNVVHLLAAYNAGPGNLRKWLNNPLIAATDPVVFIESIPFSETRNYVKRVLANLWQYKTLLKQPTPTRLALALHTWPRAIALAPAGQREG